MRKKYDAILAGHICLDIIPKIPDTGEREISSLFKPGKLIQVENARVSTGGPVSNTGLAMKKLGLNVAFMSRVGKDQFGEMIVQLLQHQGQTSKISISEKDRTSYTIAIAPPGIDRIFLHDPGANDHFTSQDLDEEIIAQSKIFHFGYPPLMKSTYENDGKELVNIFQLAKKTGAITSLDIALPDPKSLAGKALWKKILENVLPFVDIFLPSIEEALFMTDPAEYSKIKSKARDSEVIDFIDPKIYFQVAKTFLSFGSKIVALKTAHRGFYILTGDMEQQSEFADLLGENRENWSGRELWCPAFKVENIASATGSGDSSIAGFLSSLLKNMPIEKCLKFANIAGYQNLHELDAVSGIKSWEETVKMVDHQQLELIPLNLENAGWQWDVKNTLWIGPQDKN